MQLAVAVWSDLFTHRASGPWSDEHGRVLTLSPFPSSQTKYSPAANHFFHLPGPGEMHGCLHAGSRDAAGSVSGVSPRHAAVRLALASASLPQTQRHCGCVSCCGAAQRWVSMVTPRLIPRLQVFQKRKFSFPSKEPFCWETQRHLPQPAPRLPANEPSLGSRVPAACPPGSYFQWQSALVLRCMSSSIARPERALCCRIELTRHGAGFIASPSLPPWSKSCFPQHPPLLGLSPWVPPLARVSLFSRTRVR